MSSRPSISQIWDPLALETKNGSPPTFRNARTGELTPPGMNRLASANNEELVIILVIFAPRTLACIADKSLEICQRCRLKQQNSPARQENSAALLEKRYLFSAGHMARR